MAEVPKQLKCDNRLIYNEKFHPIIARVGMRSGLTIIELAKEMKVSASVLRLWKDSYPEFAEALLEGRRAAEAQVEDSLFRRCIGIKITEKTTDSKGEKIVVKELPPDPVCIFFYLCNRKPEMWKHSAKLEKTVEITGGTVNTNEHTLEIKKMDNDMLLNMRELQTKRLEGQN